VIMVFGVLADYDLKPEIGKDANYTFLRQPIARRCGSAAKTLPLKRIEIVLFVRDHLARADLLNTRFAIEFFHSSGWLTRTSAS